MYSQDFSLITMKMKVEENHTENVHGPLILILDNTKSLCKASPKNKMIENKNIYKRISEMQIVFKKLKV